MKEDRISRRKALGLLGAALPIQQASAAVCRAFGEESTGERLLDLFARRSSAAAIGAAYLASRADKPDAAQLLAEFVQLDPGPGIDLDDLTPSELRSHVQRRVAQDFMSGRTTRVDGWVLSDSEVRLYALAATGA